MRKHLTTLQRALNNTSWNLSVCAPIVTTAGLPKLTLALGFHLEYRDNLGTGLHQFNLGEHISVSWKILKYCVN